MREILIACEREADGSGKLLKEMLTGALCAARLKVRRQQSQLMPRHIGWL